MFPEFLKERYCMNAHDVLANNAGHRRGNVSSDTLRNNLAEVRAFHRHGNNNTSRTRDLSWITIPGACNYAAAEITYIYIYKCKCVLVCL